MHRAKLVERGIRATATIDETKLEAFGRGEVEFKEVLALSTSAVTELETRALALLASGRNEACASLLELIVETGRFDASVLLALATCWQAHGDAAKARAYFCEAIAAAEEDADTEMLEVARAHEAHFDGEVAR